MYIYLDWRGKQEVPQVASCFLLKLSILIYSHALFYLNMTVEKGKMKQKDSIL